jgi:hypothetical protein
MTKNEYYRQTLRSHPDWDTFLMQESGLPGPRGNLELAQAVADEGDLALFERYASLDAVQAPTNSPAEFLTVCGVIGLGRLLAEGQTELFPELRRHANDPRWRTREGVAMGLQRLGDVDMASLLVEMRSWAQGNFLEQRAAAAALCEPRLLKQPEHSRAVLSILDTITVSIQQAADRQGETFQTLRKGMGYCWSVAVTALPSEGKPIMERWFKVPDKDIRWIMKENLKKNRLVRLDPGWVARWNF